MDYPGTSYSIRDFSAESQWNLVELDAIWSRLDSQITPFAQVLNIPGDLFRALDDGAKTFIARTFMSCVNEPVMFCRDGTGFDRYFLGNPRHLLKGRGMIVSVQGGEPFWLVRDQMMLSNETNKSAIQPIKPKEAKIPRPPNAYILYRKERHSMVKDANPGITNNEISHILGAAWNNESREVRQKYKEMSEQIKKDLLEKHPDYQYRPRKPSEKKRRIRRKVNIQHAAAPNDAASFQMFSPESMTSGCEDF